MSKKDGIRPCRFREAPVFRRVDDAVKVFPYASCNCGWRAVDSEPDGLERRRQYEDHRKSTLTRSPLGP